MSEKTENMLFHFSNLHKVKKHILPNMQLLVNEISKSNDPFENKEVFTNITYYQNSENSKSKAIIDNQPEKINRYIRNGSKITCFTKNCFDYFGVENLMMWAHYGDNHKGICLGIDEEEFRRENQELTDPRFFKDIKYDGFDRLRDFNNYPTIELYKTESNNLKEYFQIDFRHKYNEFLFFTKTLFWEQEAEKRLLVFDDEEIDKFCMIKKSLKAIYLGINFNEDDIDEISKLVKETPILKLKLLNGLMIVDAQKSRNIQPNSIWNLQSC